MGWVHLHFTMQSSYVVVNRASLLVDPMVPNASKVSPCQLQKVKRLTLARIQSRDAPEPSSICSKCTRHHGDSVKLARLQHIDVPSRSSETERSGVYRQQERKRRPQIA